MDIPGFGEKSGYHGLATEVVEITSNMDARQIQRAVCKAIDNYSAYEISGLQTQVVNFNPDNIYLIILISYNEK